MFKVLVSNINRLIIRKFYFHLPLLIFFFFFLLLLNLNVKKKEEEEEKEEEQKKRNLRNAGWKGAIKSYRGSTL